MSLVKTPLRRNFWRLGVLALLSLLLYGAMTVAAQHRFERHLLNLQATVLTDYLMEAFPPSLFSQDPNSAADTIGIRRRMDAFNKHHATIDGRHDTQIQIELVRVGPVQTDGQTQNPVIRSQTTLNLPGQDVQVSWLTPAQGYFDRAHALGTLVFFLVGLLVIRLTPQPASINAYPLARDMAILFDRKVSANQNWGAHRLTHLGGGGQLSGVPSNDPNVCNDVPSRLACLQAIQETYHDLRPQMLESMTSTELKERFKEAMDNGFCRAREQLENQAPMVYGDYCVTERFRPFVRDEVLGFALITLESPDRLASLTGIDHYRIQIDDPPLWLIGGYEIYYPRALFELLVEEIRAGLYSAYGRSFDHLHVHAPSGSFYINLDFRVTGETIEPEALKRLNQYLAKPFLGGLSRTASLLEGQGRFEILDSQNGFDITKRQRVSDRAPEGLVNRISFRKVRPEELAVVQRRMNTS